jgi:hypothetical protein
MPPCRLARPGCLIRRCRSAGPRPGPACWSRPRSLRWGRPAAHAPSRLHGRVGVPGSGGLPVNGRIARPRMSACDPGRGGRRDGGRCRRGRPHSVGSAARSWIARSAPTTSDPVPATVAWPGWSWMVMDGHGASLAPSTGLTRPSGRENQLARGGVRSGDRSSPRTPCSRAGALRHRGRADGGDPRPTRR